MIFQTCLVREGRDARQNPSSQRKTGFGFFFFFFYCPRREPLLPVRKPCRASLRVPCGDKRLLLAADSMEASLLCVVLF